MLLPMRVVTVHEVPEQVTASVERDFIRNLYQYLETERPRLVLDCSALRRMDKPSMHLLLSCLEEAMKRNGDVRLAALAPEAEGALQLAGLHHLFETYSTTAEAVQSFQHRPVAAPPAFLLAADRDLEAESAA